MPSTAWPTVGTFAGTNEYTIRFAAECRLVRDEGESIVKSMALQNSQGVKLYKCKGLEPSHILGDKRFGDMAAYTSKRTGPPKSGG